MRTTLIRADGTRLVIEASHVFRNVRVWVPGTEPAEIVTVPFELAGAFAQAVLGAGQEIQDVDLVGSAE